MRRGNLKIARPDNHTLVLSEKRLPALLGLFVWVALVGIFYLSILRTGVTDEQLWHTAVLVLFPLCLLPYLLRSLRTLKGQGSVTFDGGSGVILRDGEPVAPGTILKLQLATTNFTCEELQLSALMENGHVFELYTGGQRAQLTEIAGELADLLDVPLTMEV